MHSARTARTVCWRFHEDFFSLRYLTVLQILSKLFSNTPAVAVSTTIFKITSKSRQYVRPYPGVQKPHCEPWAFANRSWHGCNPFFTEPIPSTVVTAIPVQPCGVMVKTEEGEGGGRKGERERESERARERGGEPRTLSGRIL